MTHARSLSAPAARRPAFALALALFGLALIWALLMPLSRALLAGGLDLPELAFWRALLAGGVFFVHAGFARRPLRPRPGDLPLFVGFAVLGIGTVAALAVVGLPARDLRFWLYLAPALLAAAFWLVCPPSPRKLQTALFAAAGLGLLALFGAAARDLLGGLVLAVCLVGCLHFARRLLAGYAPVAVCALGLPLIALGLWPLVTFAPKGPLLWLGLLAFALLSSYLLYALVALVLRHLGVPRTLASACVEPIAALLAFSPMLAIALGPLGLLAAALAAALVLRRPGPRLRRAGAEPCRGKQLHHPV